MITIKAITNSNRKVTIIPWMGIQENGKKKVTLYMEGSRWYFSPDDGYIHLCEDIIYSPEEIREIKEINTYFFAGKIEILCNNHQEITSLFNPGYTSVSLKKLLEKITGCFVHQEIFANKKYFNWNFLKSLKNLIKTGRKNILYLCGIPNKDFGWIVREINSLHLGGSWQKFYEKNENWIEEAEKIKGNMIFLT